jgi:hypothetical protein
MYVIPPCSNVSGPDQEAGVCPTEIGLVGRLEQVLLVVGNTMVANTSVISRTRVPLNQIVHKMRHWQRRRRCAIGT